MKYPFKNKYVYKFLFVAFASLLLVVAMCVGVAFGLRPRNVVDFPPGQNAGVEVDFSVLTYAAIGDSITAGADLNRGYEPMDYPYPEVVKEILGLKKSLNYGANGTYLTDFKGDGSAIVSRYTRMADDADIVSVLGGINDFCEGDGKETSVALGSIGDTDVKTIYGALNTLAAGLKAKYPQAFIFFMTPMKVTAPHYPPVVTYELSDLVQAIKDVAAKHNLAVLDLYRDCPYEVEMTQPYSDGIHPTQDFVREELAPRIAGFIQANYAVADAGLAYKLRYSQKSRPFAGPAPERSDGLRTLL